MPPISMWLLLTDDQTATAPSWVEQVRSILLPLCPDSLIATGTNANFAELNRARPTQDAADFVCYSMNPQVHASDDDSLMETLEAQAETVFSARQFARHRPIVVSPVTLKPRINAVAMDSDCPPPVGQLPPQVDPRQSTLLAAAWTLGSVAALARAGTTASLTTKRPVGAA